MFQVELNYTYNEDGLLGDISTGSSGGVSLQKLHYDYDLALNLRNIRDLRSVRTQGSVDTSETQDFDYDELYRLKLATGAYGSLEFAYDSVGNIKRKDGIDLSYVGNEIVGTSTDELTGAVSEVLHVTYDAGGRTVVKSAGGNVWTYGYDEFSRLIDLKRGGQTVMSMSYDHSGSRVKTEVVEADGSVTTTYTPFSTYEIRESTRVPGTYSILRHVDAPNLSSKISTIRTQQSGMLAIIAAPSVPLPSLPPAVRTPVVGTVATPPDTAQSDKDAAAAFSVTIPPALSLAPVTLPDVISVTPTVPITPQSPSDVPVIPITAGAVPPAGPTWCATRGSVGDFELSLPSPLPVVSNLTVSV